MYRKLMEQNGGSIPFTLLGGVLRRKHKTTRKYKKKVSRNKKTTINRGGGKIPLSTQGYAVGTIVRYKGLLIKLNPSRKWVTIKV